MDESERTVVRITMVGHAMVHVYEMSIPILIPVWLSAFGMKRSVLGLVVAVGYVLFGVGALPAGALADAVGSVRLILACLAGMAGSFALVAAARGPVSLAGSLLLWGAAASLYHPAGLSLLSRETSERGTAFAYHGIAGNVGIVFGPLVATLLLSGLEWRVVVALLAVPAIAAVGYVLALDVEVTPAENDGVRPSPRAGLRRQVDRSARLFTPAFALVFAVVILEGLFYRGTLTFLPDVLGTVSGLETFRVAGRSVEPGNYLFSGLLVVGIGGQYVGGKLTDRVETAAGIAVSFVVLALVSLLFIPVAALGPVPLLAMAVLLGGVLFGEQPFVQVLVAEHSPSELRGLSYGFVYLGVFGVGGLGAAVAGIALSFAGPAGLFLCLALLASAPTALAAVLVRRDPEKIGAVTPS